MGSRTLQWTCSGLGPKSCFTSLTVECSNMIIQSDGGVREACGAAAFIIGLWGGDGFGLRYEPLMVQGTFLRKACICFQAEAVALDEVTLALSTLLK